MSSERTERPTPKRLREAREEGQIPRSRDLGQAAGLLAAVGVLSWLGGGMLETLTTALIRALARTGEDPLAGIGAQEVTMLAAEGMRIVAFVAGPLAAATVLAVVAVQSVQGGFLFATKALAFDLTRLSPVAGLKRLAPSQSGVALLKAMLSVTVVTFLAWRTIESGLLESVGLARVSAVTAARIGWDETLGLMRRVGIALFVVAAADYGYVRWQFMRARRMTKQEVKDEHRLQEGNPEVKGRLRRLQRDLFRRRMLAAVPKATVVVTNPTHYAVALEYQRGVMVAPRVVAKGKGFVALRIRELAREHGVPIVENPPLARALHKHAEVGDVIPAALFEAVAEVLAYLIRLRQLVL
jgi:flagellar biosynthetic protein FlhB